MASTIIGQLSILNLNELMLMAFIAISSQLHVSFPLALIKLTKIHLYF